MTALETLRALLSAATHGPWQVEEVTGGSFVWAPAEDGSDSTDLRLAADTNRVDDGALIVAAVNALPALLDVAEAASKAHEMLYLARKRCACWGKMTGSCPTCRRIHEAENAVIDSLATLRAAAVTNVHAREEK